MGREPKVACVEIDCPYRDWPKENELCKTCKPRWEFLKMIENGWTIPCYSDDRPNYVRYPFDGKAPHGVYWDERS